MAASSFVKMPFCRYRVGSWIKVLVPPGTPYQHHTESEMLFLISGRPESASYDSFNQVVYSSSVIFPLSHSAFFSLARSPQAYSSSGRIFPDYVQANRFLYSRRYALKTSSVSFSRVHFAMAPTSLQVRPFESNTRSQYSALVRPVIAKYFPQFLQTRISVSYTHLTLPTTDQV